MAVKSTVRVCQVDLWHCSGVLVLKLRLELAKLKFSWNWHTPNKLLGHNTGKHFNTVCHYWS